MKKIVLFAFAAAILAACEEPVEQVKVKSMHFEGGDSRTMTLSQIDRLKLVYEPGEAKPKDLVWSSTNDSIVEVDKSGNITASSFLNHDGRTAIVTATTSETESGAPISASCTIKVVNQHNMVNFYGWYAPWGDYKRSGIFDSVTLSSGERCKAERLSGVFIAFTDKVGVVLDKSEQNMVRLSLIEDELVIMSDIFLMQSVTENRDSFFVFSPMNVFYDPDTVEKGTFFQSGLSASKFYEDEYLAMINDGIEGTTSEGSWIGALLFGEGGTFGTSLDSYIYPGSFLNLTIGEFSTAFDATMLIADYELKTDAFYPQIYQGEDGKLKCDKIAWMRYNYTPGKAVYDPNGQHGDGNLEPPTPEPSEVKSKYITVSKDEVMNRNEMLKTLSYPVAMRINDITKMRSTGF